MEFSSVPAIAKLSSRFYQHFGDEITNELVECLTTMDTNAQQQLRELNELNFARFSAEMTERFASIERRLSSFELAVEHRFSAFEVTVEHRFTEVHRDIARIETRLAWQLTGIIATLIGVIIALNAAVFRHG